MNETTSDGKTPPKQDNSQSLNEPFGEGKKVLIVEDDPVTTDLIRKLLTERRFEVFQAENGKVAWDKIRPETKPDLIISDFLMPEMNGFELFKGLRNDDATKDIPILFLSARKNIEDSLIVSGADAFFPKPLETTKFLEEVKRLVLRGPAKASEPAEAEKETTKEPKKEEPKEEKK